MIPSLQKTFDALENQRKNLHELVSSLSESAYSAAPEGKWSIGLIIVHLITSEQLSLAYMRKKSLGVESLKDSGLKQAIIFSLLKISQRVPIRYTAPKAVVEHTPDAPPIREAFLQWEKSRKELKDFLETIPEKHSRRLIFKHPVAGMLDVRQSAKFMYEHVRHHLPQIKRLLNG